MSDYKNFAIEVAKEACQLIMERYGESHGKDWHIATNFKIEVDRKSDELIRRRIIGKFPDHNIYSEEKNNLERKSKYTWVIDPLDGTIPYSLGISDHFGVCVSLVENKEPILGVIYAPKREELYIAEKDRGASLNSTPISVSTEDEINHVVMAVDGGKETEIFKRVAIAPFIEKLYGPDGVTSIVSYGCASVPLALTACGKMHAYIALSLEPWDMAAAVIINREAGGKVTDLKGKEWELGDASILAANKNLHKKLTEMLF